QNRNATTLMLRHVYITRVTYCLSLTMIVLLLNACSSDEPSKDQLFNTFHVKIGNGGIEATHKTSNIIGNSSCQNLYVGIPFMIGGHAYRFNIDLIDNGRITRIRFLDYDVDKDYANASFVTAQHFEISNLEYSLMDERLYFDFSGTLFEINNASESIDISGTIDFLYYPEASCSFNPWRMEAMVNDYNFQSVFGANSQDSFGNQWIFYCDNGYYIGLELEDVIEDMPLGTYTFTTEDTHNRIDIQSLSATFMQRLSIFHLIILTNGRHSKLPGCLRLPKNMLMRTVLLS
ncbi:MAG TPA: hypothetical protein VFD80_03405, partial [Flavobacteriaceae bacterium]|nr:hypothetical protein [Flavobacteriaceae bacterium]